MPLGWERINTRRSSPNQNIVFIKPRPGPHEETSKDFLERIAAQCLPIMNRHHLAIASLEEYEPNKEFWGRNFNNGEVIQLVLKSPSTGRWLPFKFVQMVMMHELAHCKEMNHAGAFWKLRNTFSEEMRALWEKGYTGEGLWGRGVLLENGAFAREQLEDGEHLPERMCGGTFRTRGGRKRKIRPKITYKERQERRIRKKFGTNGITLGADEETKIKLENGQKPTGKPRVAGSMRGRELRAAAAMARFESKKEESPIKDEELVTDSETGSDYETEGCVKTEPDDAIDIDGKRLLDTKGRGMIKLCEGEDKDDDNAKNELAELQDMDGRVTSGKQLSKPAFASDTLHSLKSSETLKSKARKPAQQSLKLAWGKRSSNEHEKPQAVDSSTATAGEKDGNSQAGKPSATALEMSCPICSCVNDPATLTCMACSNVLQPQHVSGWWRCKSLTCKTGAYINAGDAGRCGVCGTRKCSKNSSDGS